MYQNQDGKGILDDDLKYDRKCLGRRYGTIPDTS